MFLNLALSSVLALISTAPNGVLQVSNLFGEPKINFSGPNDGGAASDIYDALKKVGCESFSCQRIRGIHAFPNDGGIHVALHLNNFSEVLHVNTGFYDRGGWAVQFEGAAAVSLAELLRESGSEMDAATAQVTSSSGRVTCFIPGNKKMACIIRNF